MKENDNELLYLIKEQSEEALDLLYKKYDNVIKRCAYKYLPFIANKGIDQNDLIQEAMLGFDEAIKNYNEENDTLFYTFAILCMDRKLKTYLKNANLLKNKILNESISFNFENDDGDVDLLNYIIDENTNPENNMLFFEDALELDTKIKNKLTFLESKIYELKTHGATTEEICQILEIDVKTVYNAIHRIKEKIKDIKKEKSI